VTQAPAVAALILAAGAGRRFGGPKAPAVVDGERLVDRAVRIAADAGCTPVVVVLGAWVGDVPGATVVTNPDWHTGMASSLRCGLAWLAEHTEADATVVTLVDLVGLTSAAVAQVSRAHAYVAAATYAGTRGHPVRLARSAWSAAAAAAHDDVGARDFLASRTDLVLVEVGHLADGADLDTAP